MQQQNASPKRPVAAFLRDLLFSDNLHTSDRTPLPGAEAPGSEPEDRQDAPPHERDLQNLFTLLFRKRERVASAGLQLTGLEDLPGWVLASIVFRIADDIIFRHLAEGDVSVRLKDNAYVIVFSDSSRNQASVTASLITDDIRQRLLASGYAALRNIGVHKQVTETRTADLKDLSPAAALSVMTPRRQAGLASDAGALPAPLPAAKARYMPLWDRDKNALTAYIAQPADGMPPEGVGRDLALLGCASAELAEMSAEGREFFLVCPVRHETLYHHGSFALYAAACRLIPEEQRQMLVLMITDPGAGTQQNGGYWFAEELKKNCGRVFLDMSVDPTLDLSAAAACGIDALGVRLDTQEGEQLALGRLNVFQSRALAAKIPQTFVLGVATHSMTTAAVSMGFDFLGGSAIHDQVAAPNGFYRFRDEELFADTLREYAF